MRALFSVVDREGIGRVFDTHVANVCPDISIEYNNLLVNPIPFLIESNFARTVVLCYKRLCVLKRAINVTAPSNITL